MVAAIQSRGNSTPVTSNQHGPHANLANCVLRHLRNPWCEPLHKPSVRAFDELKSLLRPGEEHRLMLDSGCGTGESTLALAQMHPQRIIIGADRSRTRLRYLPPGCLAARQGDCLWIRARLETFWRLVYGENWGVEKHYLLYPNPWPKSEQLNKRWHAHPALPVMLAICGNIELRCNWKIYAEEFASVTGWITGTRPQVEPISPGSPLSPFEKKYAASGHPLFRVCTGSGK